MNLNRAHNAINLGVLPASAKIIAASTKAQPAKPAAVKTKSINEEQITIKPAGVQSTTTKAPAQTKAATTKQKPKYVGDWHVDRPLGPPITVPLRNVGSQPAWIYCPGAKGAVGTHVKHVSGFGQMLCTFAVLHFAPYLIFCGIPCGQEYMDQTHRCSHCKADVTFKAFDPFGSELKVLRKDHEVVAYTRQTMAYAVQS